MAVLPSTTATDVFGSNPPLNEVAAISTALPVETIWPISSLPLTSTTPGESANVETLTPSPPTLAITTVASTTSRPVLTAQLPSTSLPHLQPVLSPPPSHPVADAQVITLVDDVTESQRQELLDEIEADGGAVIAEIDTLNVLIISASEARAQNNFTSLPFVVQTEPDYYVSAQMAVPPSDPLYPSQWALSAIGVPEAWLSLEPNLPRVTVAVIDSGICEEHVDLRGRILTGYDFVDDDFTPQDEFGHGCAVSGIIAANADNGLGMAGIAPNAYILPLRVLNRQGIGLYSDVAAAIIYAVDNGAQIINLSLGGTNRSSMLQGAIDYAISRGVTVVAAAGNTGSAVLFPASYAPVMAVGSIDQNLERSGFSSYGPEIDMLAPGRDIVTTSTNNRWSAVTGTSFAAPQVSAVAAIELARGRSLAFDGGILSISSNIFPTSTPTSTPTPTLAVEFTEIVTPTEPPLLTPIIDDPDDLTLVPGNAALLSDAEQALREVLVRERSSSIAASNYYAVSALHQENDWYFVSVVGLMLLDPDVGWRLDDANWFGLVVLHSTDDGTWQGAVEGTVAFTELLALVPATVLTTEAKQEIDPLLWDAQAAEVYRFPWETGTRMRYGTLGVHNNGFNGVVSEWKAVDFLSNGDTSSGNAPNRLLAAAAGSIGYVCDDGTSAAIQIGNLFYSHLLDNNNLVTGKPFNQGDELGQLRSGTFNNRCGYADQGASWFHVHWGFPNINNAFTVEDWTLTISDSLWRRGSEARGPNNWFLAGSNNAQCPAPVLNSPANNASLNTASVTFSWTALSACAFSGYTIRVNDSSDMEDTPIIDASVTGTSYTATIAAQWHNKDLWWGVRAANSTTGAEWATRRFRISIPDTTPPTGAMAAPANNSYQRGPMIWLQATASDSGSGVNRVEFFAWLNQQWVLLNTDYTAPYEYSWDISNTQSGSIWLSANIIDNAGNQSGIIWGTFVTIDRSLAAVSGIGIYYNGSWYLRNNISAGNPDYQASYGGFGTPLVGDWNGNGTDTFGIYNPANGSWFLRNRNDNGGVDYPVFTYGSFGIPVVGDWDGNGTDTIGIYDPASGVWYLRNSNSSGAPSYLFQYGGFGVPVVGDWDGDGTDTIGIYNPTNGFWYLRNNNSSGAPSYLFQYGGFGVPVVGDWDGDGTDTIGIYDPASGVWYLRNSNSSGAPSYTPFVYGGFGSPVVGTWNVAGVFSLDGAMTAFSGDWGSISAQLRPTVTPTTTPSMVPEVTYPFTATIAPTQTFGVVETATATASPTDSATVTSTRSPTNTPEVTKLSTLEPTYMPTTTLSPTQLETFEPTIISPSATPTESPVEPTATVTTLPTEPSTNEPSTEATQETEQVNT